jgi:hypothetical protein
MKNLNSFCANPNTEYNFICMQFDDKIYKFDIFLLHWIFHHHRGSNIEIKNCQVLQIDIVQRQKTINSHFQKCQGFKVDSEQTNIEQKRP